MNKHIYGQKQIGKYTVKVYNDEIAENPRTWCDHSDHMICFHRRYTLGDEHDMDREELLETIKRKDVLSLPIYAYEHGGITINTGEFSCQWDSGQVGWIYMTKAEVFEVYNPKGKILTKKLREQAYEYLRSSVKEYDQYLTGEVYGFVVEDESGSSVESCWGFYGDSKDCLEEGIHTAQACIRHDIRKHVKIRKVQIKNRVPIHLRRALEC